MDKTKLGKTVQTAESYHSLFFVFYSKLKQNSEMHRKILLLLREILAKWL